MNIPLVNLKAQYRAVDRQILAKLKEILSEQRLILGQYCSRLEQLIADYSGVASAVTCANGTDALILALMALDVQPGDEVITTPYTFFSTASSIALLGGRPVFVDVAREDLNINPELIERAITPKTKAITVVHLFGKLCNMQRINAIAQKYNLAVVEDMAQSLGSRRDGVMSGNFGDIAAVSFYPTKNLGGIGEGGMVLSKRADLGDKVRNLRVHGMGKVSYNHDMLGLNSRLDEIKACALAEKFPHLEEWNRKRIENALFYNRKLAGLPISVPDVSNGDGSHIIHQYVIRVQERDALKDYLAKEGVGSGIYYPLPLHMQPVFAKLGYKEGDFPIAEEASRTSLALPVYPELKKAEKAYIVATIRDFFQ